MGTAATKGGGFFVPAVPITPHCVRAGGQTEPLAPYRPSRHQHLVAVSIPIPPLMFQVPRLARANREIPPGFGENSRLLDPCSGDAAVPGEGWGSDSRARVLWSCSVPIG